MIYTLMQEVGDIDQEVQEIANKIVKGDNNE